MLDAIAAAAVRSAGAFNAQDLTNTAWAYATLGHSAPELLDALAVAAVEPHARSAVVVVPQLAAPILSGLDGRTWFGGGVSVSAAQTPAAARCIGANDSPCCASHHAGGPGRRAEPSAPLQLAVGLRRG